MKMQAALWYGPEDLRVERIEIPAIQPDEVLVRVGRALTCGTDFKLFRRGHALLVKNIPSPFGHELAGTIAEVGSRVRSFDIGDRVVAANSAPCGDCFLCREKRFNLCENLEFLNGAYAEYIRIPSRIVQKNLYKIPNGVAFREAASSEPLACALHCIERVEIKPDESLCIIGAGPCGLLFVQLAKLAGTHVIVVGRREEKLAVAKKLGADHVLSTLDPEFKERLRGISRSGLNPDVVIEVVGQPATWELATEIVRKGGHVWFYGGCARGTQVSLNTHRLHYDEISCHGVFHHTPDHFRRALALISDGKIRVDPLIAGERRLADLTQVFQKGTSDNPLKIEVIP